MGQKYKVIIESGNIDLFNDAIKLLKYIDKQFRLIEVKEVSVEEHHDEVVKNNLGFPPLEKFVSEPNLPNKEYSINYSGRSLFVTKKDFVKYCFLILEKFNVSDCYGQYKILKRYGCDDEDFFLLFGYSVSDLESILKGKPYPYVAQRWSQLFSQVVLLKEQREQEEATEKGLEDLKAVFGKEEVESAFEKPMSKKYEKQKQVLESENTSDITENKEITDNNYEIIDISEVKTIEQFVRFIKQFDNVNEFLDLFPNINRSNYYNWKNNLDPNDASRRQIGHINKAFNINIPLPVKEKRTYYVPKQESEKKTRRGRKPSQSIKKLIDCSTVTTIEQLKQLMIDGKFTVREFTSVVNANQTYANIRNGKIPTDKTIDRLNEGFGFSIKHYGVTGGRKNIEKKSGVPKQNINEIKSEQFDPHNDERIYNILKNLNFSGTLKMLTITLKMNKISMKDFSNYFGLEQHVMSVNISRGRPLQQWIKLVFERYFPNIEIREENIQ